MIDYFLRTDTEDAMDAALEAAGILSEQNIGEGEVVLLPAYGMTLDRIGPIPIPNGDTRYHANLRVTVDLTAEQVAALPLVDPLPTVPYRVFI
jgi:hypothetical protein